MNHKETEQKDIKQLVLDAYFENPEELQGHYTSLDVCDNLRSTVSLEPEEVTSYLLEHGWRPRREGDGLVWEAPER